MPEPTASGAAGGAPANGVAATAALERTTRSAAVNWREITVNGHGAYRRARRVTRHPGLPSRLRRSHGVRHHAQARPVPGAARVDRQARRAERVQLRLDL